jgi:hypothetical protein
MPATYDDAAILMQVVRWGTEMGLDEAGQHIFSDDFDAGAASVDDLPVGKLLAFGETIGTLVKHGILDKALVLDLYWIPGTWARVGPAAMRERERLGEPRLYENYEAMARGCPQPERSGETKLGSGSSGRPAHLEQFQPRGSDRADVRAVRADEQMAHIPVARRALVAARARDLQSDCLDLEHGALQRCCRGHHHEGLLQFLVEVGHRAPHPDEGHRIAPGPAAALVDQLGDERQLMHGLARAA